MHQIFDIDFSITFFFVILFRPIFLWLGEKLPFRMYSLDHFFHKYSVVMLIIVLNGLSWLYSKFETQFALMVFMRCDALLISIIMFSTTSLFILCILYEQSQFGKYSKHIKITWTFKHILYGKLAFFPELRMFWAVTEYLENIRNFDCGICERIYSECFDQSISALLWMLKATFSHEMYSKI